MNAPYGDIKPTALTLGQMRSIFTFNLSVLIPYAFSLGYEVRIAEAKRSDEQAEINAIGAAGRERVAKLIQAEFPLLADKILNNGKAGGIRNTVHGDGLAVDIDLFMNGVYLDRTGDHKVLGLYWEKLHLLNRWGGRFDDGNHYSMEYRGRK